MSSGQCEEAVRRYSDAYLRVNGVVPEVHINRGWIKIEQFDRSYRPWDVHQMAERLERRRRIEHRIEDQDTDVSMEEHQRFVERLRRDLARREREYRGDNARNIFRALQPPEEDSSIWDVREELNARVQSQIQEEVENAISNNESNNESGDMKWPDHIRKGSIINFFNALFEKANHNTRLMQVMIDSFISNGYFDEEKDCDECELHKEIEIMRKTIYDRDNEIEHLKEKRQEHKLRIRVLENQLIEKNKNLQKLKNNSIIFSMDEVPF